MTRQVRSIGRRAVRNQISETQLQEQITELAHMLDWESMHVRRSVKGESGGWVTATSVVGWPDLVLWHPKRGRILYRELKSATGKLTADQQRVLLSLRDAGADVDVWRPADWNEIESTLRGST